MLLAGEEMFPEAVELELGASGWHRIYVCLAGIGGQSQVEISLSGGRYKTTLRPSHTECVGGCWAWAAYEWRAALDARSPQKRIKINAVVYFDVQSSKYFGCDVETWAKEGLIDSVSQGLMKHYEVLDGCLGADGLIDLQKYAEKKGKEPVLRRYYGDDEQTVVSGLHDFMRIAEQYDIEFFAALPWENKPYEYHLALAKALYEAGARKFICWNANHIVERPPVLAAVKRAGEKEKLFGEQPPLRRLHRVLAVGGRDISEFNPNWRG